MKKSWLISSPVVLLLAFFIVFSVQPLSAEPIEKDIAQGDESSYMYGAASNEVLVLTSTATGDVNGDGVEDLIMGHDQGGTSLPYFYTGKIYI